MTALTAAALVGVAACGSSGSSGSKSGGGGSGGSGGSAQTIQVADIEPLSGGVSSVGIPADEGAQLAADNYNAAGGIKSIGGAQIKLVKYDDQADPNLTVTKTTQAIQAGAVAVMGGESSTSVLAGTSVAQRSGVPDIVVGGTANAITQRHYSTTFQVIFNSDQYAGAIKDIMTAGLKAINETSGTVAFAYPDSDYGQQIASALTTALAGSPLNVTTKFSFPEATTDMSSVAARLASAKTTIIVAVVAETTGVSLAQSFASTVHPTAKLLITPGAQATQLIPAIGAKANGYIFTGAPSPTAANATPEYKTIAAQFKAKYGQDMVGQALEGYLAMSFIIQGLEKAGKADKTALLKALPSVQITQQDGNLYPAPATLSFDSNQALKEAPLFFDQIQNGQSPAVYPLDSGGTIQAYNP